MSSLEKHPVLRTMQVLWVSLTGSHVLLALVLWFTRFGPGATPSRSTPPGVFLPAFGAVALVQAVLSFVMPSYVTRAQLKMRKLGIEGRPTDEQLVRLLPALQTGFILGMALSESISLLGFVLGFLGAPVLHFAPFFGVGLGLALARFPGENWVRAQVPARDVR